jgi:hypothetical protein
MAGRCYSKTPSESPSKQEGSVSDSTGSFFLFFIVSLFFLAGCAAQKRSCPPIATAAEATAVLKGYSAGLKPLKATGSCSLNYTDEKGQRFAQSFPVRIWYVNNRKFCLYGDVLFDPKAVCFAVNGDEFWVYAKPFDLYITEKNGVKNEDYFSNPAALVDFLEPVGSDCLNVVLADSKDNSILTCKDSRGYTSKRIFIDQCSRVVKKAEYFNSAEEPAFVVEADEYKKVIGEKFSFPRKLNYKYLNGQNLNNWIRIKIDSVKLWQANPQQLKALFSPPDANSIEKEAK